MKRLLQKFSTRGDLDVSRELVAEHFDPEFYLRFYPDIAKAGMDPLDHYLEHGWSEGRSPAAGFIPDWYAKQVPGLSEPHLVHYLREGRSAGISPFPPNLISDLDSETLEKVIDSFDAAFYLDTNPDVIEARVDPVRHFLVWGWRELRDPSPDFDVAWYLEKNEDIRSGGVNPFVHWLANGKAEGRAPSAIAEIQAMEGREHNWETWNQVDYDAIEEFFDRDFYVSKYPQADRPGVDPIVHYLVAGWKKGLDPSPDFSTRFYLESNPDVAKAGLNPFAHWCRHGRHELRSAQFYVDRLRKTYRPKVSVIVPNYNHARYLRQRIVSISGQSHDNLEIILLDDCSTDDSRETMRQVVDDLGIDARLAFNEENSGNVFAQWEKGISLATGDLIWICESDDFCDPDFLEHIVPAFADLSVNIAFGRIQFANAEGERMDGLDQYREGTESGIWSKTLTRPACEWFNNAFGVNNVIANVGGCVFRRMNLAREIWDKARTFKIAGDWYLYIQIAGGGQITYEPRSVAWFRQHQANTSATNFHQRYYYDECRRILGELIRTWGIKAKTRKKFLGKVRAQYEHFQLESEFGSFDELMHVDALMLQERERMHVQLHFLGFEAGGGELFSINLANALVAAGQMVSMVAYEMISINEDMRQRLDPRIPVYQIYHMSRMGRSQFLEAAGVSVINTQVASSDGALALIDLAPIEVPYVVTLHGSYVGLESARQDVIDWILKNVTKWIYTADRNLEFFEDRAFKSEDFTKLPNAMPRDNRPAPVTRSELGIGEDDTVFAFIARGVKRKGWRACVEAFKILRERRGHADVHLLLVGEGESVEQAREIAQDIEGVHFLGYQSAINGLLRLSDCMLLPTRFEGESFPLCLIQALQENVPTIATDIGEIRSMMSDEQSGDVAGIMIANERNSQAHFAALAEAMEKMCDPAQRGRYASVAAKQAEQFDMDRLVESYLQVYRDAARSFAREKAE